MTATTTKTKASWGVPVERGTEYPRAAPPGFGPLPIQFALPPGSLDALPPDLRRLVEERRRLTEQASALGVRGAAADEAIVTARQADETARVTALRKGTDASKPTEPDAVTERDGLRGQWDDFGRALSANRREIVAVARKVMPQFGTRLRADVTTAREDALAALDQCEAAALRLSDATYLHEAWMNLAETGKPEVRKRALGHLRPSESSAINNVRTMLHP